jgi:O-antigen ligase
MALGFLSLGLWLSQTRSAIGALLVGMVGLGAGRRWLIGMVLVGLVAVGMISGDRHLANLSGLKQWTSDRIYLWQVALERIEQRPLLGWGYDGFGIAYGNGEDQNREIVSLEQFSFTYRDDQGELQVGILPSNKAHNLVLDSLLSVGILGTIAYGYLWSLSLGMGPNQLSFSQLKVMGWAYLAFTLLWFESAQYSHLAWWAMTGLWASKPMVKLKDGNSDD